MVTNIETNKAVQSRLFGNTDHCINVSKKIWETKKVKRTTDSCDPVLIERGVSRYKARSAELDAAVASKHVHRLLSLRIVKSNSQAPFFCAKRLRNKNVSPEFIDCSSVSLRSANCIVDMRFLCTIRAHCPGAKHGLSRWNRCSLFLQSTVRRTRRGRAEARA